MIRLLTHSGFAEPSNGVQLEGLAIRGSAKIKVQLQKGYVLKKLSATLYRTSKDWPNAHIKIQLNDLVSYRLRIEDIGQKEISIDLPSEILAGDIEITFSIYPKGILKVLNSFLLKKTKTLVRDSLLINSLYLDGTKILNYHDRNRFAYGDSLQQNQIQVRILGFFGQTFGLAEAARRTFSSLEKTGFLVKATQIPCSCKHLGSDYSVRAEKKMPTNPDEIRIFHFNGDHFDKLISDWGKSILNCRYKIGFWHWELPEFPNDYLPWFDKVDEIWVPSKFVFDAIAPKTVKPVQIIPLAIDKQILKPPLPNRKKFSIPSDKVVFLITFDFYSILERKNPIAGIKAFSKLIENDKYKDIAHLVVKVSNQHADHKGYDILLKTLSALSPQNITFIDKVLPRMDMMQLINSIDSLISLHRSEGFGLHLAEAMAMGKAVIATNWSGNTDFMNYRNSYPIDFELVKVKEDQGPYRKGNVWTKALESQTVESMKKIFNSKLNQSIIKEAELSVIENLSMNEVGSIIEKRLKWIMHNL